MPHRPFPLEIGVGIDIVLIPRVSALVFKPSSTEGDAIRTLGRFTRRFLTHREQKDLWARFQGFKDGLLPVAKDVATHLAGRCVVIHAGFRDP